MKRHFFSERLKKAVSAAIYEGDFDRLINVSHDIQAYLDRLATRASKEKAKKKKGCGRIPLPIDMIMHMRNSGMRLADIALEFHVSTGVIQKRVAEYNKKQQSAEK